MAFYVVEGGGVLLVTAYGGFFNERRTSGIGIPIVIKQMMKTRVGYRSPKRVTVCVHSLFECYNEVKDALRYGASSSCDHTTRAVAADRDTHTTFVWMGGKILQRFTVLSF